MAIFSEIYSVYYRIAERLLSVKELGRREINTVIYKYAFQDSMDTLIKKIMPREDNSDWGLFIEKDGGKLSPVVLSPPKKILTSLQKRWLVSILNDARIRLFMDDDAINVVRLAFGETKPLFTEKHFRYTDKFSDGDDFTDERYIRNFRAVLSAIKEGRFIKIVYLSAKSGAELCYVCQPLKLEYSAKNDKFRLRCRTFQNGGKYGNTIINIGTILFTSDYDVREPKTPDIEEYYAKCRAEEPVVVRVTEERNGIERFLTEFAAYEKHTVRDIEKNECITKIWYDRADETELLIRLLSFGPVIEILGPEHFRELARERVLRQSAIFQHKSP